MFERHDRVFLGFSGGKESIVLARMLEPWRARVTLLWVNTGHMAAHMVEFVRGYRERFELIELASPSLVEHWQALGPPVDVAPAASFEGTRLPRFQTFHQCCFAIRQAPINAFLREQPGRTCFVNGQRRDDHGATFGGLRLGLPASTELVMPLAAWSEADVYADIERHGLTLPPQYAEGYPDSIECTVCPAQPWPPRMAYLRRRYPEALPIITDVVRAAATETISVMSTNVATVMGADLGSFAGCFHADVNSQASSAAT